MEKVDPSIVPQHFERVAHSVRYFENVEKLACSEHQRFSLDLQQSDGTETRCGIVVSDEEEVELAGSKGTAHMVFSFEKGGKHVHLSVLQVKKVTRALTADDAGKFVPVVAFDCRGCEPVKFTIGDGWVVNSPTAEFQDVDLSDDWADFDDKSKLSVSVMNVRTRFIVHRGPV